MTIRLVETASKRWVGSTARAHSGRPGADGLSKACAWILQHHAIQAHLRAQAEWCAACGAIPLPCKVVSTHTRRHPEELPWRVAAWQQHPDRDGMAEKERAAPKSCVRKRLQPSLPGAELGWR